MEPREPTNKPSWVLVVDDDDDIRETLAIILEEEGYQVGTAANGSEAFEQLATQIDRPCLILLDMMMPVMDGWEFLTVRRSDPRYADIPVAVVTASAIRPEEASALGVADVLQKPVELDRLVELVAGCCHAASLRSGVL